MQWFQSDYLANKLVDHLDGNAYSSVATVYLGLFTTPLGSDGSGTEVSGGGYARKALTFAAAASGEITTSAAADWNPLNTLSANTIVSAGIFDASSGGNLLFFAHVPAVTVAANAQITVAAGDLTIGYGAAGHVTEYLAEKWLDRVLRNQAWSTPNLYLAQALDVPARDGTFTEVSGGSYARQLIQPATVTDNVLATDGTESYSPLHSAGNPQDLYGVALMDAGTSGNALLVKPHYADESVLNVPGNDTLSYAAGDISVEAA